MTPRIYSRMKYDPFRPSSSFPDSSTKRKAVALVIPFIEKKECLARNSKMFSTKRYSRKLLTHWDMNHVLFFLYPRHERKRVKRLICFWKSMINSVPKGKRWLLLTKVNLLRWSKQCWFMEAIGKRLYIINVRLDDQYDPQFGDETGRSDAFR